MKKFILLFIFLMYFSVSFSQSSVDTSAFGKIREEVFVNTKAFETLVYLCDVLGPRLMWSPQYKESAEWIREKLHEWGIEKVYFEDINKKGKSWTLKNFHATVKEPFTMILSGAPKEWTYGTKGTITSEVEYFNAKSEEDFQKYKGKLSGKIVLMSPYTMIRAYSDPMLLRFSEDSLKKLQAYQIPNEEEKKQLKEAEEQGEKGLMQWAEFNLKKIKFLQDEGAAVIIEPSYRYYGIVQAWGNSIPENPKDIFDYLIAFSGDPKYAETVPQVCISLEQYNSLARAIEKGAKVTMEINVEVENSGIEDGFNVIAEIPGSEFPDEIVTIGGHLDSYTYATAATDNTTGVVACLEAIRIIKSLGIQPKRTIRIGLWAGEEEGLLGSKYHSQEHFVSGKEKCFAYYNMDFGAGRFRGIYTEENKGASELFNQWMKLIGDPKFQTTCLMKTKNSDHQAFQDAGLNGFAFIQDAMDYWKTFHTNMDMIERINREDYKNDIYIMTIFAWLSANMQGNFPSK